MNLSFWITWFRYQRLKIFPFEYLVWKQGSCRKNDFLPKFAGLIRRIFFWTKDWIEKCWNEGLNWRRILKAGEGGWIIINDRIFLPHRIRKIRLCSMHPYPSDFFPFFPLQISCWFPCLSCWLESCRPRFYWFISKETAGASWSQLWKERKELYHPLINGN